MEVSLNQKPVTSSIIDRLEKEREEKQEQLASGQRINSAADDPAGLQIASRLTSQINNDAQQSFNAQDQINVNDVQGAQLSAINEGLQRANTLSVQSGNPLSDPNAIQGEFDEITEQINTVAEEVFGVPNFLTGLDANDPAASQQAIEDAFGQINDAASALGAESNALGSQVSTYETSVVNVSASRSRIVDTDFAETASDAAQIDTLLQAAVTQKKDEESRKGLIVNQLV